MDKQTLQLFLRLPEQQFQLLVDVAKVMEGAGGYGNQRFHRSLEEFMGEWTGGARFHSMYGGVNYCRKKITEPVREVVIPPTTGCELPGDIFDADIPGEPQRFYGESLGEPPTPETTVAVETITAVGSEYQIFAGFPGKDFGRLSLTRGQIIRFCEENREKMASGTLFIWDIGHALWLTHVDECQRIFSKGEGLVLSVCAYDFPMCGTLAPGLVGTQVVVRKKVQGE